MNSTAAVVASDKPPLSPKRRPGRPTLVEAGRLKDSIINAAVRQFQLHGFEATSMEGIAREAGVARLTLYRQFESKEELFMQMARRAQLRVRSQLQEPIDTQAPLEDSLRELIGMLYDGFVKSDYMATMRMVAAESDRFPALGRAMLGDVKKIATPIVRYLTELQAQGRVRITSPDEAATQLIAMASGAGRYLLVRPSPLPKARARWVNSLTELFYRAWRP